MAKILMIDDDPDIIEAVRIPLEARGHQVYAAHSGPDGLRMVKELAPDLIILDVMMDSYTEGFHVSLTLRSRALDSEYAAYRNVPILMLTSIHQSTKTRFAPDEDYLPVDAFMEKGASPSALLAKVDELLARAAGAAQDLAGPGTATASISSAGPREAAGNGQRTDGR
ncbi:MAG: response regulator transcription factor [Vicinamibacterales bacterium]